VTVSQDSAGEIAKPTVNGCELEIVRGCAGGTAPCWVYVKVSEEGCPAKVMPAAIVNCTGIRRGLFDACAPVSATVPE
jgi:hypothetical protein